MDGSGRAVYGFGSLMPDAGARLDLPAGFCCRVLSTVGDAMAIAGPWEQRSDAPQAS